MNAHTRLAAAGLALVITLGLPGAPPPVAVSARTSAAALPARLTDAEFWKLVTDISEPGGYFRITDNYTSNEQEVGQLFTMLRQRGVEGGVYIGVGPEQNFSYIAAIRPAMAFVIDIRRQAVMQHLMFKAVFELAKDRADFISLLFSKSRPANLDASTPIQRIWEAYATVPTDSAVAARNAARIVEHLQATHKFTFDSDESEQLTSVLAAFVAFGPAISTRGSGGGRGGGTFVDLTGWSLDTAGQPQSFLSTEEHYRVVKSLQEKNLIVPVSGDFGGPHALRAMGTWLKGQGATVSAYYVSNVEQYLFQDGKDRAFYENVASLPITDATVFIRPYSMRRFGGAPQSLCPVGGFITAVRAGRVGSNNEALMCAR